jgi:hypothetical protein
MLPGASAEQFQLKSSKAQNTTRVRNAGRNMIPYCPMLIIVLRLNERTTQYFRAFFLAASDFFFLLTLGFS